jgi:hypothetical protein
MLTSELVDWIVSQLSFSACGARNFMKTGCGILPSGGSGEVESAMERLRPSNCLIRSVRA